MMRNVKDLRGYAIRATDGVIGRVDDFYFDDEDWGLRYLVVDTGKWLSGRKVLISPIAIGSPDWMLQELPVSLTKTQVRRSPDIDTRKPVSRQHEAEYSRYYGYPYYWGGAGFWGMGAYPGGLTAGDTIKEELRTAAAHAPRTPDDSHLRSTNVVIGYQVHATDGNIGRIDDLLVDDHTWAIRYLIVDTNRWWTGAAADSPGPREIHRESKTRRRSVACQPGDPLAEDEGVRISWCVTGEPPVLHPEAGLSLWKPSVHLSAVTA
jgi:sporulation protein YlmC with PRC-barrel domain